MTAPKSPVGVDVASVERRTEVGGSRRPDPTLTAIFDPDTASRLAAAGYTARYVEVASFADFRVVPIAAAAVTR